MPLATDDDRTGNRPVKYIVGAYVGSPALELWDPVAEAAYYDGLKSIPGIRGLEHPFYGKLHRDDDEWFLANVKPEWDCVLMCIPGTMERLQSDPTFGLASIDIAGRHRAIEYHARARDSVVVLNEHLGRQAVIAVQIHSAPRQRARNDATAEAFRDSLNELTQWDWQGGSLVVEHCDSFSETHEAEKGFLAIEEEIRAIRSLASSVGMIVNRGRSAIDGRSAETPLEHIRLLRGEGLLDELMFSGATATDEAYGAWKDKHMPPAGSDDPCSVLPQESLMTSGEIRRCLDAAGSLRYVGAKVMLRPKTASLAQRVVVIRETLAVLDTAYNPTFRKDAMAERHRDRLATELSAREKAV